MENRGLNLEKELLDQSDKDWNFGSVAITDKPTDFYKDLPTGEVQRRQDEDKMACTTFGLHNVVETIMNNKIRRGLITNEGIAWLREKGYMDENDKLNLSDRYNAILAGTTRGGNSLKAPIEAFRLNGAIPESDLAYRESMSWNDFYNTGAITNKMKALGKEFLEHFPFNYERVYRHEFDELLDTAPIDVAGYAWPNTIDGVYQYIDATINHCFELYKKQYFAFDSYEDYQDNYIKQLAPNYLFLHYGYRIILSEVKHWKTKEEANINEQVYPPGTWLKFWYWWNAKFTKTKGRFRN